MRSPTISASSPISLKEGIPASGRIQNGFEEAERPSGPLPEVQV